MTQLWNWSNRCIFGLFVTQNFCLHELWNLFSFKICPNASLTHRRWEIQNPSTQTWEIAIFKMQDWSVFAWISTFSLKIKQKSFNLVYIKLHLFKIGLMDFEFLKACGSSRLWSTFWSYVCLTIHASKSFVSQKVPKYTCLNSFIVESLYLRRFYNNTQICS